MSKTVAFHTFGCKVNQYDTQAMLEKFQDAGYKVTDFENHADIYVVNTCTVTNQGDKKSLQMARRIRRERPRSHLILAGCLSQRKGKQLISTGARLILGNQYRARIVELVEKAIKEENQIVAVSSLDEVVFEPLETKGNHSHTRAMIKIQEGCNNNCTYCIIPSVRGPIRSRGLRDIKKEAENLAKAGFAEIVITGIHISSYGVDLNRNISIYDAINAIDQVEGIKRIRLGSLEPNVVNEKFINLINSSDKICPQFHLALQSGSDNILKKMRRRYNSKVFLEKVDLIRKQLPLAAITTDVMVGFPGESREDFEETLKVSKEAEFSHMHIFPYSPRKGTPAADYKKQLAKEEKHRRVKEAIAVSKELTKSYLSMLVGTIQPLLIETNKEDNLYSGYIPQYVLTHINSKEPLAIGKIIDVKITDMIDNGLKAEVI